MSSRDRIRVSERAAFDEANWRFKLASWNRMSRLAAVDPGMDAPPCIGCGKPVECVPDGMPTCPGCARAMDNDEAQA